MTRPRSASMELMRLLCATTAGAAAGSGACAIPGKEGVLVDMDGPLSEVAPADAIIDSKKKSRFPVQGKSREAAHRISDVSEA